MEFEVQLDLHNSGQTLVTKHPAYASGDVLGDPRSSYGVRARGVADQPVYFSPVLGDAYPMEPCLGVGCCPVDVSPR